MHLFQSALRFIRSPIRSVIRTPLGVICLLALALPASAERPRQGQPSLRLSSPAFATNREIPSRFTCEGADVSPPLAWDGLPPDVESLVLIVEDPDAPDPAAPLRPWVHWVLLDIPSSTRALREDARELPPGTMEGLNDFQRAGYRGPCPAVGRHRYVFRLFALDAKLKLMRPSKARLEEAMADHILARAELVGMYEKKKR